MKILNGEAILGDCLEEMKNIPDGSIDCIITDPPYKVISGGKPKYKGQPSGILSKNDGKIFNYNDIKITEYASELFRILKNGTHCYVMCNLINIKDFLIEFERVGFGLHNLLIWEKNNKTPNRWYMKNIEYILFLRKGKAKKINSSDGQILKYKNSCGNKLHPTEKPVELIQRLVENSSKEGDIILDPFSGSNSLGVACENTNRKWICIEKDENYYNIGINRLNNLSSLKL